MSIVGRAPVLLSLTVATVVVAIGCTEAPQYGQLFGHATADGRLDTIEYFDSELSN